MSTSVEKKNYHEPVLVIKDVHKFDYKKDLTCRAMHWRMFFPC